MGKRILIKINPTRFFAVTLLISGTLSIWFLFINEFASVFKEQLGTELLLNVGLAVFFGSGALSAIIGSQISNRVDRRKLILLWTIAGLGSIALLTVVQGVILSLFLCILIGISIGFGLPSCMALLAEYTLIEERAKVAGAIIFATFVMIVLEVSITSFLNFGSMGLILFAILYKSISIVPLTFDSCKREKISTHPWKSVFSSKNFMLYLIPWTIFNFIGELDHYVWPKLLDNAANIAAYDTGFLIQYAGIAVFALVAGFVADRLGRRPPFIASLIILGVSFVILGLYPIPETIIAYLSVSGLAWSSLMVIYLCVVGDLSLAGSREKFYAVGFAIPLTIYMFVRGIVPAMVPSIMTYGAPPEVLSPALSIALFLSIIPVLQAKETLSEQEKNERKIREHIEKVGRIVQESKKES